jgi:hypothetical protein
MMFKQFEGVGVQVLVEKLEEKGPVIRLDIDGNIILK